VSFLKHIKVIKKATTKERKKEMWDVSGIIESKSNQEFKFDLRPIIKHEKNLLGKKTKTTSKANKIVFDIKDQYIIIDVEELNEYVKTKKLKKVYLQNLMFDLEWNIIIKK